MLEKFSYKSLFISLSIFFGVLFSFITYYAYSSIKDTDVNRVSIQNFKNKFKEREEFFRDYFESYINSIDAIKSNEQFIHYIDNGTDKKQVQELFLSLKKSMPCVVSYSYIDIYGNEKIRVDGTPVKIYKDNAEHKIVDDKNLKNISDKKYFKKFKNLKINQVGISEIYVKEIYNLRKPIIIFAKKVVLNNEIKGFVFTKLCLHSLLHLLQKTTLYNINMIDNEGRFLAHYSSDKGIKSSNFYTYKTSDEYGDNLSAKILNNDEYIGKNLYSSKIKSFDNGQNLKIIMSLKFANLSTEERSHRLEILYTMLVFILFAIPIVVYFSKLPDRLLNRLKEQLVTDKTTGYPNRVQLFNDLEGNTGDITILIAMENLKKLLSVYGYDSIDEIMQKTSKALDIYLQSIELEYKIYTFANHTLAIKTPFSTQEELYYLSQNIHNHLESIYITLNNGIDISVDITIGISDPFNINDNNNELKEAEVALAYAKSTKEDIVVYDTSSYNVDDTKEILNTIKIIKKSIEKNRVLLHYQPIYNNKTDKIEKYETLMRLEDSEGGILYPNAFLDIAKDSKKYQKLTKIMIKQSFEYFKDKDCEFSINLSAEDIYADGFIEYITTKIIDYDISSKLVVEIVESESINNYDKFHEFIKLMKKLGCKVAIDDFGSGYSNFEHIINLSDYIDYVKIDGSLIKHITTDIKSQLLVDNIQRICTALGIKTIAEFVENKEILEYIKSISVDYTQGYYISKPLPDIQNS
jgi:EAL domain-containing protein (putative c-di-GMP-specific phosphodiesterase class I)/GGDEF domain-containing protein